MHLQFFKSNSQYSALDLVFYAVTSSALVDPDILGVFEVDVHEILAIPEDDFVFLEANIDGVVDRNVEFDETEGHIKILNPELALKE